MIELLSNNILFSAKIQLTFLVEAFTVVIFYTGCFFPQIIKFLLNKFVNFEVGEKAEKLLQPYKYFIGIAFGLGFLEIVALVIPVFDDYPKIEIFISFILTIEACWLFYRLLVNYIDDYIVESALKKGRQANSGLFSLLKFLAFVLVFLIGILFFTKIHNINIISVLASLGIIGVALAFAVQKVLEQIIATLVLSVDHPFYVDDYIGLPDGTFGRVESIGWRSTKIRTSGKGTVMVIPNNSLTNINIENFSGAKKVISILYLNFPYKVELKEQALIRQVVLTSTKDIFGLDSRSTRIDFLDIKSCETKSRAQISLFILGSGKESIELRRQLLDVATENINQTLKEYGIDFDIEGKPTIYVDAPVII
ncbi:MAG: mechanosensitive ion channel domain-containing protein [Cyanobacteria bacterium P01_D01_bin.50]